MVNYHRTAIQTIGGLVLIAFGWRLYTTRPSIDEQEANGAVVGGLRDYLWDVPKTFILTVTNPGAVLGLFAIFGGISTFVEVTGPVEALLMVGAVMAGSLCWWVGLSYVVARLRSRISLDRLTLINRIAGIALVGFGILLIGEIAYYWLTGTVPERAAATILGLLFAVG